MTRSHSIATNTAYTDILAQNHESYLQLRRQQRTILSSARTPRVRRRESNLAVPSFSKRFKTRYVPLTKRVLLHNVSPNSKLGRQALHKAFSAPVYQSHLNGRNRPRPVDQKHVFRYKTLRAKKRPAELLPRAPTRTSSSPSSAVPNTSVEMTVSSSSVSVSVPVMPTSPADPVALCISNMPSDPEAMSQRVTLFGVSVSSSENTTGKIWSYAEYWLETSKAELKKLKEPLKKQTAALENVAHKMVRPTSSGYKKVRGYMHRDAHKPHFPHVFSTVFRGNAPKEIHPEADQMQVDDMPTSETTQAPQAPPATGASSEQLSMVQNSRNMLAVQKSQETPSSACGSSHSETDTCVVCQFLERANLQRQELYDTESRSGSMEDSFMVKSAPGRMIAGMPVPGPVPLPMEPSISPREAGIVLIQQVLEYLKSTGNGLGFNGNGLNNMNGNGLEMAMGLNGLTMGNLNMTSSNINMSNNISNNMTSSNVNMSSNNMTSSNINMSSSNMGNTSASESYLKSSGFQYTASPGKMVRRSSASSIRSSKHSVAHEPALAALIKMLLDTLQSLPSAPINAPSHTPSTGVNGSGISQMNVQNVQSLPSDQTGSGSSSSSDTAISETNPEASFNNQVVPSIFGCNYLVLSPISSFDGTFNDESPEPIENDCGFLDLRSGPSRLLKQVRFIVDEEFNAQDTSISWYPQSSNTLGSIPDSELQGYLMELGGSDETLVLQSASVHDTLGDNDNFSEFGYQMLASGNIAFASEESLDSGYFTARSSKS